MVINPSWPHIGVNPSTWTAKMAIVSGRGTLSGMTSCRGRPWRSLAETSILILRYKISRIRDIENTGTSSAVRARIPRSGDREISQHGGGAN